MNVLFVTEHPDSGSTHALVNYMSVGAAMGHTFALHGLPQPRTPGMRYSTDVRAFDRIVYEFDSHLCDLGRLRETTLLATIPREHRYVHDADGMYNPVLVVDDDDRNHTTEAERIRWQRHFDALATRIFQPVLTPPDDPRVVALPFYGYNPALVVDPRSAPPKRFDVLHVANNWWRWKDVSEELLPGLAQIRDRIGEIGFIGMWWDGASGHPAYRADPEALRRLRIHVATAVSYSEVIPTMSTARINILTQRPMLRHLKHLTFKYFEIFCADTIPLLLLDEVHAEAVYGPAGRELALSGRVAETIEDALRRPHHYQEVVAEVRRHLLAHHAYERRVEELVSSLGG